MQPAFHGAGMAVRTALAAGAIGIFLTGTAFAASGEDAYREAAGTEKYADVYDMADLTRRKNSFPGRRRRFQIP